MSDVLKKLYHVFLNYVLLPICVVTVGRYFYYHGWDFVSSLIGGLFLGCLIAIIVAFVLIRWGSYVSHLLERSKWEKSTFEKEPILWEEVEKHETSLRALSTWMMTHDFDMKSPDEVIDPDVTADIFQDLMDEIQEKDSLILSLQGRIKASRPWLMRVKKIVTFFVNCVLLPACVFIPASIVIVGGWLSNKGYSTPESILLSSGVGLTISVGLVLAFNFFLGLRNFRRVSS